MKRNLIILAIMIAATGCSKEVEIWKANPGPTFTISLVNTRENNTRTPGDDRYNENLIEKADLFFFDADGNMLAYPEQSQLTYSANKVVISMSKAQAVPLFNQKLTLYMLANCALPRSELAGKTQEELSCLVQENPTNFNLSQSCTQSSFLMEGTASITNLDEDQTDLGSITLTRAAAKVVVNITEAAVAGYTATGAAVCLVNCLDKTVLSSSTEPYAPAGNDYTNSVYRPVSLPGAGDGITTDPFYSYANDWGGDASRESYLTVRVTWRKNSSGESKDYYYRIPFTYVTPTSGGGGANYRLKRNHIYTFNVRINALGGSEPEETIVLEPYFELKDWTTRDVLAELNQYDFLVVAEKYVEMHDIPLRLVHFTSSKPVTVQLDSAYYFQYHSSGNIYRIDLTTANGLFYPSITADEASSNIVIQCNVPLNYVPTYMQFTVINGSLRQTVRVVQYPRQYITSRPSKLEDIDFDYYKSIGQGNFWQNGGNGATNMTNFNLYTITTTSLSADDNFVIGGDMMEERTFFMQGRITATKGDEETNRMISPKFVVASQRGIITKLDYNNAAGRCAKYSEGKYPVGSWRLPTVAEMALIAKLQNDTKSAIKDLFVPASDTGGQWGTARVEFSGSLISAWYICNVKAGSVNRITGSPIEYPIRCVHDVWQDE